MRPCATYEVIGWRSYGKGGGKGESDEEGRMVPDDGIGAAAVGDGALLTFCSKWACKGEKKTDFRDECDFFLICQRAHQREERGRSLPTEGIRSER